MPRVSSLTRNQPGSYSRRRAAAAAALLTAEPKIPAIMALLFMVTVIVDCVYPRLIFVSIGGYFSISLYTIFSGLSFLFSVMLFLGSGKIRKRWWQCYRRNKWALLSVFAFFGWFGLADIVGMEPTLMLAQTLKFFIYYGSCAFTASVFFIDERLRHKVIPVILVCALFDCLFGAFEFTQAKTLYQIFHLNLAGGADDPSLIDMTQGQFRNGVYRCQSIFNHPILYGQFVATVLPVALYWFRKSKSWLIKISCVLLFLISPFAIYSSGARSALGVAVISLMTFVALLWVTSGNKINLSRMVLATSAILLSTLVLFFFSTEIVSLLKGGSAETIGSTEARVMMLQQGFRAVLQSPIYGFGEGSSVVKAGLSSTSGLRSIDNYYLTVAIDAGLVGLSLLIGLFYNIIRTGIRVGLVDRSALAVTAMVFGMAIGQTIISVRENLTFVFMAAGFVFAIYPASAAEPTPVQPARRRGRAGTAATRRETEVASAAG